MENQNLQDHEVNKKKQFILDLNIELKYGK